MGIVVCRLLEGALVVNCASCHVVGLLGDVSRGLDFAAAETTTGCVGSNCPCFDNVSLCPVTVSIFS